MTEVNEPIGEPIPEPVGEGSELDDETIDELADDDAPADMRTVRRMRAEAKKLRHRLRESEANRVSEQEARAGDLARLAELEKREVERAAGTVLIDPNDLWLHTDAKTQSEFNDEFGAIVGDRVVEAAKRLAAERPHLAKPNAERPPSDRPIEGLRPGASPESTPKPLSWSSAIHGTHA